MEGTDMVDIGTSSEAAETVMPLSTQILMLLKEKAAPEISLASQDLEVGKNKFLFPTRKG